MATKSAISFGLVHIPIALHTAIRDVDVHFNQLHKEDNSRIRYKKTCAHCGKEIGSGDIVKGFEYEKDHYVIVTNEDLEAIKTEKDRTMQILHFTTLSTVSPVYYDKTYHAVPEAGGDKAFELLRSAMMEEQVVAIAKTVMGSKETLLALIPREDGLLCQTMFYQDEIKSLPDGYNRPEVVGAELEMARKLIASMVQTFDPSQYRDEYQQRLRDLIAQKIAGREVVSTGAVEEPVQGGNVINLLDALKASLDQQVDKKEGA